MRIAITADPDIPVPPHYYGGIERIIHILVQGLVDRSYHVTLFAHRDSQVPCTLIPYPAPKGWPGLTLLQNMWHVSVHILHGNYDLVHSFGRLAYILPLMPWPIPKIMSYQRAITRRSIRWGQILGRKSLHFSGCSHQLIHTFADSNQWHVVHNGVPTTTYTFRAEVAADAPLVFLGRIEAIKGTHLAIEVARRSNHQLIIAGNIPSDHQDYFDTQISPYLNTANITYIGPVNDQQKNELLGNARVLLMPVLWDEPFGIVMAEALACGTPVIGFRRGAVPEVVQDGVNGFVCDTVDEMVEAVRKMHTIDRSTCRSILEERFSDRAIVDGYERLYKRIIKGY
jgi:glycosyltransferase involved in cell wall biosynthesis